MTTLTPAQTTQLLNTLQQLSNNLSSGTAPIAAPGGRSTVTLAATPANIAGSLQAFVPPEFTEGMASIKRQYTAFSNGLSQFGKALDEADQAAEALSEPLRVVSLDIQKTFGGFRNFSEQIRNDVGQDLRESYDTFAETFVMSANELRDASQEKYIMSVDGTDVNVLSDIFENASEYQYQFTQFIEEYKDTYGPALAKGLKDSGSDIALFQENFNLTTQQLGDFVTIEVARTGKATTTMMDDLKTFSYGMSAQTGISAKLIAKDTVNIVSNVEKFGNVTVEQAARMSTALKQLGVDYSQLDSMIGQFQSFDTAAQKVGELSAVFGIHLDAVEMMNLANTDQEAAMFKLREAFEASGQSLDDMNIAQKNLLTTQAGFTDVKQMEMFFSGQVDSMEELQAMSEEAATEEEAANAVKAFNQDLADLSLQGAKASDRIDKMSKDMVYSFRSIAPEIAETRSKVQTAISAMGGEITQVMDRSIVSVDNLKNSLGTAVKGGGFADIGKNLSSGFTDVFANAIPQAFGDTINHMVNIYNDSDFLSSSPSKIGLNLANGIIEPLQLVKNEFESVITEASTISDVVNTIIAESGLPDVTDTIEGAGVVANASVTELLKEYQEKIQEVQGIINVPDQLTEVLGNVADMREVVENLLTGLQTISSQPLKISYDSGGRAEDALFNVLKDYISVSGGQVVLNYPE